MIIILVLFAVFFGLAFMTKRRFGVLGPALIMGYLLQQLWQSDIPNWARMIGLPDNLMIAPVTLLGLVIVLVPSLILLLGGPVYGSKRGRLLGSLGYATLATVLCAAPVINSVAFNYGGDFIAQVIEHSKLIITGASALMIVDMLYVHVGVPGRRAKAAKH